MVSYRTKLTRAQVKAMVGSGMGLNEFTSTEANALVRGFLGKKRFRIAFSIAGCVNGISSGPTDFYNRKFR